ncbi:hypothetical protein KUTeg_018254 [Tegillarca granosa]|uniref:Uncharacterized protein n=1 Tax=Tegillarca granosa TaxID=220873 RepID=A0ABQ9EHD1_TEGGR|nr:hypothetical protein KUTeg_018254 [Tegillarca granosa]
MWVGVTVVHWTSLLEMVHGVTINVIFYSSVIMDASHPSCDIEWNGTYLIPTTFVFDNAEESLLPGCFVMDSREGYHMTYYWFHLLDWSFT